MLASVNIPQDVLLTIISTLVGIVTGYFLGLRTNFVIGRVFEYRAFLHQALIELRLMSGKMMKNSSDFSRVPRADQAVRLFADQIEMIGQVELAASMREVAKKMEEKFNACRHRDTDLDFHPEKKEWIVTLECAQPKWGPFFRRKKSA